MAPPLHRIPTPTPHSSDCRRHRIGLRVAVTAVMINRYTPNMRPHAAANTVPTTNSVIARYSFPSTTPELVARHWTAFETSTAPRVQQPQHLRTVVWDGSHQSHAARDALQLITEPGSEAPLYFTSTSPVRKPSCGGAKNSRIYHRLVLQLRALMYAAEQFDMSVGLSSAS